MPQDTYVYVSYPRTVDMKFDSDYYINKHMAIVDKHWVRLKEMNILFNLRRRLIRSYHSTEAVRHEVLGRRRVS